MSCCIRDVTLSPTARGRSPAPAAGFVLLCDLVHESRHSESHELQEALRRVLLDQGMKARVQQHHLDFVLSMHQRVKQTIYQRVDLPLGVCCLPASTRQCRCSACMVHKRVCMVPHHCPHAYMLDHSCMSHDIGTVFQVTRASYNRFSYGFSRLMSGPSSHNVVFSRIFSILHAFARISLKSLRTPSNCCKAHYRQGCQGESHAVSDRATCARMGSAGNTMFNKLPQTPNRA